MNVSSLYAAFSRVLLFWVGSRLPASKATMVADLLVLREMLEVVQYRLRRVEDEGGTE